MFTNTGNMAARRTRCGAVGNLTLVLYFRASDYREGGNAELRGRGNKK